MIKIATDPDNRPKYVKLTKNVLIATVLITISLTLVEIPKSYFGSTVEVTDGKIASVTIDKIEDKDCKGREVVNIDGKRFVVTKSNATISSLSEKTLFMEILSENQIIKKEYTLYNCSILKNFSECQGTFKGYFADIKYYRDSDGLIFPATSTYSEYKERKDNNGGGFR